MTSSPDSIFFFLVGLVVGKEQDGESTGESENPDELFEEGRGDGADT